MVKEVIETRSLWIHILLLAVLCVSLGMTIQRAFFDHGTKVTITTNGECVEVHRG